MTPRDTYYKYLNENKWHESDIKKKKQAEMSLKTPIKQVQCNIRNLSSSGTGKKSVFWMFPE